MVWCESVSPGVLHACVCVCVCGLSLLLILRPWRRSAAASLMVLVALVVAWFDVVVLGFAHRSVRVGRPCSFCQAYRILRQLRPIVYITDVFGRDRPLGSEGVGEEASGGNIVGTAQQQQLPASSQSAP